MIGIKCSWTGTNPLRSQRGNSHLLCSNYSSLLLLLILQGLALINGTQFISALGSEAYFRSKRIADQADVIAALSIDVLKGTPKAFDQGILRKTELYMIQILLFANILSCFFISDIHLLRPHQGQLLVASRLRSLLDSNVHPSEIRGNGDTICNSMKIFAEKNFLNNKS